MGGNLKSCLSGMAVDPDRFSEFVADPKTFARNAGLSAEETDVLLSGDQNAIYLALQEKAEKSGDPSSP